MFGVAKAMLCSVASTFILVATSPAWSQAGYPVKPIRIVTPNPPGGIDNWLRVFQPRVADILGQQLIIESRPGASGVIGAQNIARSLPDGYSLLFSSSAQIVTNPFLIKDLPYDPVKDFSPISKLMETVSHMVAVRVSLPVSNLRELIDYAKANPGKLTYGSSGTGSIPHFSGELFKLAAGIDMLHVPYKGVAQIMPEVAAGRLDVVFASNAYVGPLLQGGKVKVLAAVAANRYSRLPDVPSVVETVPSFRNIPSWFSLFGPAALPRPVLSRIHEAFSKASKIPELRASLEDRDVVIVMSTPEELASAIRADTELTARVIKVLGLKPD